MSDSELYLPLIQATGEAVWLWWFDDRLEWHDSPYSSTLGIAGLVGTASTAAWVERLHPEDADRVIGSLRRAREQPDRLWSEEYRLRRDDGGYAVVVGRGSVLRDASGGPVRMVGTIRDVTGEREAQRKLAEAAQYTAALFQSLPGAMYHVGSDLRFVRWNDALRDITGYGDEELATLHVTDLFAPDDHDRITAAVEDVWSTGCGQVWADLVCKDGRRLPYFFTGRRFTHDGDLGYVGFALSMSEQVALQQRLHHEATHDSLTGLANRRLLHDTLTAAIAAADAAGHSLALFDLDLDRFKVVNDGFGHPFGDVVLRAVADRLRTLTGTEDTLARMGGDEFVILVPRVRQPRDIEEMARRLVEGVSAPFVVHGRRIDLSASIGISLYPRDGRDGAELIDSADMAMYHAKTAGRRGFRQFTPDMARQAQRRTELEIALRSALESGQLRLAFQPKLDLRRGSITGGEALLRWDHPRLGPIAPSEFIPIAEDSGLILPIGEWVLEEACRQGRAWLDAGLPPVSIAVNVAVTQLLQVDPVAWVDGVLERTAFPAELLELELTESQLAQDAETAVAVLGELRSRGIKVAIDDFGTGYSGLQYLRRFDVTSLKIDRSFVDGIFTHAADAAIVRAAVALAQSFGLKAVAEGVETEAQKQFLTELGCDEIQGFLVGKPATAEDFGALLSQVPRQDG